MSDESPHEPAKPRYRPVVEDYPVSRPAIPPPPPASKVPVTCPGCSANLKVPSALVGKSLRCPKCRFEVQVPWGLAAAANAPVNTAASATPLNPPANAPPASLPPPVLPVRRKRRRRSVAGIAVWVLLGLIIVTIPTLFVINQVLTRTPLETLTQDDPDADEPPPPEEPKIDDEPKIPWKKIEPKVEPKLEPKIEPKPDESKAPPIRIVAGRETPPWVAASFLADAAPVAASNLWSSAPDGTLHHWSNKDFRKVEMVKLDRPLAAMATTVLGVIGQYVDPDAKDTKGLPKGPPRGAGNIHLWNPGLKKTAPTLNIPYKGSVDRFLVRDGVVVFLDSSQNQLGELRGAKVRIVPIKSPGARAIDVAPGGRMFVLCGNNVVEVYEKGSLERKSKFELDGATITDLAAWDAAGRQYLGLIGTPQQIDGPTGVITTNAFLLDVTGSEFTRPMAVLPLPINHPCRAVTQGYFIGEKKITSVFLTPPQVLHQRTVDIPSATTPGRVAVSSDKRLMAIPGGLILGLD